jgi:hypothetical protein
MTSVTYSSSNESVASVDAEGNVTVHKAGTATITATAAADDVYYSATAQYLIVSTTSAGTTFYRVTEFTAGEQYLIVSAGLMELTGGIKQKLRARVGGIRRYGDGLEPCGDGAGDVGDDQHDDEGHRVLCVIGVEREQRLREEEVEHDHGHEGDEDIADIAAHQYSRDQNAQDIDRDNGRIRKAQPAEEKSHQGADRHNGAVNAKIPDHIPALAGVDRHVFPGKTPQGISVH